MLCGWWCPPPGLVGEPVDPVPLSGRTARTSRRGRVGEAEHGPGVVRGRGIDGPPGERVEADGPVVGVVRVVRVVGGDGGVGRERGLGDGVAREGGGGPCRRWGT